MKKHTTNDKKYIIHNILFLVLAISSTLGNNFWKLRLFGISNVSLFLVMGVCFFYFLDMWLDGT